MCEVCPAYGKQASVRDASTGADTHSSWRVYFCRTSSHSCRLPDITPHAFLPLPAAVFTAVAVMRVPWMMRRTPCWR